MPLYQLIMRPSPEAAFETLQFIAGDVQSALLFADKHTSLLPAELWCDGRRLCGLEFSELTGKWKVFGQEAGMERGGGGERSL